jgi:hypothetical protein
MQWGEVMECIKAQANGSRGERISAAVIVTDVIDPNGRFLGGFACEYSGSGSEMDAQKSLLESILGMIVRREYGEISNPIFGEKNKTNKGYIIIPGKRFIYDEMKITEKHGSVFVAICFISYLFPVLRNNKQLKINSIKMKTRKNKK